MFIGDGQFMTNSFSGSSNQLGSLIMSLNEWQNDSCSIYSLASGNASGTEWGMKYLALSPCQPYLISVTLLMRMTRTCQ